MAPRRVFKRKRRKGLITALKVILPLIAVSCVAYMETAEVCGPSGKE